MLVVVGTLKWTVGGWVTIHTSRCVNNFPISVKIARERPAMSEIDPKPAGFLRPPFTFGDSAAALRGACAATAKPIIAVSASLEEKLAEAFAICVTIGPRLFCSAS
jgi:hypothetical protein